MEKKQIVLLSAHRKPVYVDLQDSPSSGHVWKDDFSEYKSVFADERYCFKLNNFDINTISSIRVFVNDDEIDVFYNGNEYAFSSNGVKNYCVFRNKFGFVELSILITYEDGNTETWHSGFLSVLVHKDQELESINMMIDYVYNNQDQLLITGDVGTKKTGDVKPGGVINLETKISLASEILKVYRDNYGYFSANSRFKTDVTNVVDDSNKLQNVTPKTLQYIATHPGYLREGKTNGGVKVGNRFYIPQKTLVQKNIYSYDIYENRVIVGFIGKMIDDIGKMISDISQLLEKRKKSSMIQDEYIHSSYFIFQRTEKALRDNLMQLRSLKKEFELLSTTYKRIIDVKNEVINKMPKPSAIFMAVPQYNVFFNHMHRWFSYGIYNLEQERFMMSFINGSALYEVYVLAKLLDVISSMGYHLEKQYKYSYRFFGDTYYRNTLCNNTFEFSGIKEKLILYYQPVIYSGEYRESNEIHLYRNNSLAVEGYGTYYYTPDYVIKYEKEGKEKYIILDAKYGDRSFVRKSQTSKLAFKYIFSISPRNNESIGGLYVLYGGVSKSDKYESIYDKQIPGNKIKPIFDLIPISASINNEKHSGYLSKLIMNVIQ